MLAWQFTMVVLHKKIKGLMNEFFSSRPNFPSQFYGLVGTFWVVVLSMFIFQSGCLSNTLALACEFWQLTFTLQSEEKMDDVLKSGHFSILTISICSRTCVCTKCVFTSSLSTITTPILYFSSPRDEPLFCQTHLIKLATF